MEALPDYYGALGVPRHTDRTGIRRAYLRKARQHHPDLNPDDSDASTRMSAINTAYTTLSDPVRRARYDAQRISLYLQPSRRRADPTPASHARPRSSVRNEPSVLDSALALLMRLVRYATATLPL